ncbi:MAG: P-II family nitrogen regulator, partial [Planctomycetota bacterium]
MHLIIAYIRPERLSDVKRRLVESQILKISVTNALGCGDERNEHERYRGAEVEVDLHKRIRLEVAVNQPYVQKTVDAIVAGGRTGEIGDGKIFVLGLADCVRIRTGERGDDAIG